MSLIANVGSARAAKTFRTQLARFTLARIPGASASAISAELPSGLDTWIDFGIEGALESASDLSTPWHRFWKSAPNVSEVLSSSFLSNPDRSQARELIKHLAIVAKPLSPALVSVPQFAAGKGTSRNKANKVLAQVAGEQFEKHLPGAKRVFPIIFTGKAQYVKKTSRNPRVRTACSHAEASGASGYWVVDQSMRDQDAIGDFESHRFPGIIDFHSELLSASELSRPFVLSGPFWGLNLLLWARGLATHSVITLGGSFRHFPPGGIAQEGVTRLAIPCLRRTVRAGPDLRRWLQSEAQSPEVPAAVRSELSALANSWSSIRSDKGAAQILDFYSDWHQSIDSVSSAGRPLALYQQLSSAFVAGSLLSSIPTERGRATSPGIVAKQLMTNCLSI